MSSFEDMALARPTAEDVARREAETARRSQARVETQTLAAWLLERIAEDEQLARECIEEVGAWRTDEPYPDGSGVADRDAFPSYPWGSQERELAYMADPAQPSRVLAEREAKRRIVRTMQTATDQAWQDGEAASVIEFIADRTLRLLALPYADRPGFREEWRP